MAKKWLGAAALLALALFGKKKKASGAEVVPVQGDEPEPQEHPATAPEPGQPPAAPLPSITPAGDITLHSSQARVRQLERRAEQGLPWLADITAALTRKGLPTSWALPITKLIGIESGGKVGGKDTSLGERGLTQITKPSLAKMGEPLSAWEELASPTTSRARQADLAVEHQAWLISDASKRASWTGTPMGDPLDGFWLGMLWRGLPLLVGELTKQGVLKRLSPTDPSREQIRHAMGHYVPSQRILWWALDAKRNAAHKVIGPGTLAGLYDRFVTYANVVVGDQGQ